MSPQKRAIGSSPQITAPPAPAFSPAELLLEDLAGKGVLVGNAAALNDLLSPESPGTNTRPPQYQKQPDQDDESPKPPVISSFVQETHASLVQEMDELQAEVDELEQTNAALHKEVNELKNHVKLGEETLERDVAASKQYEDDVLRLREQIRSGELTLLNMEEKANHVASEKEARTSAFSDSTCRLVEQRSSLSATFSHLSDHQQTLSAAYNELLSKLQAKEDVMVAVEQESRFG